MRTDQDAVIDLMNENTRLRTIVQNAAVMVDAILRGNHGGWDRRMADIREALSNTGSPPQPQE